MDEKGTATAEPVRAVGAGTDRDTGSAVDDAMRILELSTPAEQRSIVKAMRLHFVTLSTPPPDDAEPDVDPNRLVSESGGPSVAVVYRFDPDDEALQTFREKAGFGMFTVTLDLIIEPLGVGDGGCDHLQRIRLCGSQDSVEQFARHIEASALAFAKPGGGKAYSLKLDPVNVSEHPTVTSYREQHSGVIAGGDIVYVKLATRCDGFEDCEQVFVDHKLAGPRGMIEALSDGLADFLRDFAVGGESELADVELDAPGAGSDLARAAAGLARCDPEFVRTIADGVDEYLRVLAADQSAAAG